MSAQFPRCGIEEYLTKLVVIILCDGNTGCDEIDDHFATEADTMIYIQCDVYLNKYKF